MYKCDPTRGVGFPGPFPSRQGVSAPSRQGVSAERERPLPAALADLLLGILNHGYAIPVLSYNPYELWGARPFPASRKPTPLVSREIVAPTKNLRFSEAKSSPAS